MQSRTPDGGDAVSLDDLRGGKAGQLLPRSAVDVRKMVTLELLPQ